MKSVADPIRKWEKWAVVALLALAIALRARALLQTKLVLTEGTTYITLARNIAAGHGYVGILGVVDIFVPPAYPILIALAGKAIGNYELAARLISLTANVGVVAVGFLLARRLFGEAAGLWALTGLALHPLLVRYSGLAWSESLYTFFLWFGIYLACAHRTDRPANWQIGLAGLFLGLAYLTRNEGIIPAGLIFLWLLWQWARGRRWRDGLSRAGAFLVGFVIPALPYIFWLSLQVGHPAWETKRMLNMVTAARMLQGMPYEQAAYGVGPGGVPQGPFLQRDALLRGKAVPAAANVSLRSWASLWISGLVDIARLAILYLISWPGLLLLLAGAIIAWFRERDRLIWLLWITLPPVAAIALIPRVYLRYLAALTPLFVILEAVTLGWLSEAHGEKRRAATGALAALLFLVAWLALPRADSTTWRQTGDQDQVTIGEWLRNYDPNPGKRIMSVHSQVPYYARGVHVPMPYGSPGDVLKFAEKRGVGYIVVSDRLRSRPPLMVWVRDGGPGLPWRLLHEEKIGSRMVEVYGKESGSQN